MTPRTIDVYSADCPLCADAVALVERLARPDDTVTVRSVNAEAVASEAARLGVRSVPAVAVDGELASCCRAGGVTEAGLHAALGA
ncbi:thioredoxin family protein [Rubrivirga marina]|jgi:thioredoxin-like negative regulator of GroEL|uniref:Thioredoxin-like fold domain-containing protein n=1 Tax=Rubrivirga marina TaxID=1196024 RepID=A0A271ITY7_9BACT|nr:thioredoxin family protein [Rubrivirga marina]PAP74587.1 hypothetical protein BSZ37_20635 [Rubrivirga marina]